MNDEFMKRRNKTEYKNRALNWEKKHNECITIQRNNSTTSMENGTKYYLHIHIACIALQSVQCVVRTVFIQSPSHAVFWSSKYPFEMILLGV